MMMKNNLLLKWGLPLVIVVLSTLVALSMIKTKPTAAIQSAMPTLDVALSVTQTMGAIATATETLSPTNTPLPPTSTPQPPTATPVVLPENFYLYDFNGHRQYYAIGCEASVAVDLAKYYDVYITEYDFQMALPKSDNPDLGFVGDVNSIWGQIPPDAYGVHAAPVAATLTEFGVPSVGGKGYTLDEIKAQLAQSKPVIVWVIGAMWSDVKAVEYTDKLGNKTIVAAYEHVVVLTGYDDKVGTVRYNNNGNYADVDYEQFQKSWAVLGNMAVFHQ